MDYTEKALRRVCTYKGIIVELREDMIRLPNDEITMREVITHPGGVCVAALSEDGTVAMVRQYRYPFGRHLLELPAGKLEPGEDPLPAAQRELSEETGYTAEKWIDLGAILSSPGFSTEVLHLYLATGLHEGEAHPDHNEFLDVLKYPLEELLSMVDRGEIQDGKTVAALLKIDRWRTKNRKS